MAFIQFRSKFTVVFAIFNCLTTNNVYFTFVLAIFGCFTFEWILSESHCFSFISLQYEVQGVHY